MVVSRVVDVLDLEMADGMGRLRPKATTAIHLNCHISSYENFYAAFDSKCEVLARDIAVQL